ncbi:MAG: NAD+ synthase [Bacteroidales bacterium]|nr:NAD+ synthase [Bacteroidales bacterium]MDD2322613.1 NAD+ synthase [Bacteroidales bacterium]MDD3010014.1 NAD+ synthase [Bacteroidales bacterium]MDD3960959.1 NAD+ synthase [Bacteroidales bacterium]MDY0285720.1 NAD+ synthase [Bacteroidales bacterium]
MRIALAQINYHIGHFEQNTKKIVAAVDRARLKGCDVIVFSELAISGYPPRDFLEFDDFIRKCDAAVLHIAAACHGITAIVGTPVTNPSPAGKKLFNGAAILRDGAILGYRYKTLLPTYDVFDEYRYFEPNRSFETVEINGISIALTICEDLWDLDDDRLYSRGPMQDLVAMHPDLIVNIAASPFSAAQAARREQLLQKNVAFYNLPLLYVNHVGAQTELLFDGSSMVVDADNQTIHTMASFVEDFSVFDFSDGKFTPVVFEPSLRDPSPMASIHNALVMGVRNYFEKLGFEKAVLGLSGGIDSAVTMVIAAEALGSENVIGVLLPSQFSSTHSIDDAQALADNLGSPYHIIPIKEVYDVVGQGLHPWFAGLPFSLAEENIQARIRAVFLMALSNKFGYILLNTSNKSEAAVGYGTLYGDMCGGLSVLGDVYKTQVFEMAEYINRNGEVIPVNTITKPPSAELHPDQKDSDSLPEYGVLDQILFQYIENRKGPSEIIALGFDENLVRKTVRMVNTNEYKRYQAPPILRVSSKAFGMGRRMPIVARYLG